VGRGAGCCIFFKENQLLLRTIGQWSGNVVVTYQPKEKVETLNIQKHGIQLCFEF
jgi:hypothetical protein